MKFKSLKGYFSLVSKKTIFSVTILVVHTLNKLCSDTDMTEDPINYTLRLLLKNLWDICGTCILGHLLFYLLPDNIRYKLFFLIYTLFSWRCVCIYIKDRYGILNMCKILTFWHTLCWISFLYCRLLICWCMWHVVYILKLIPNWTGNNNL